MGILDEFKRLARTEDEFVDEMDESQESYDEYDDQAYDEGESYDDEYEEEKPQRTGRFNFSFGGKSSRKKRERSSFAYDAANEEEQPEQETPAQDDEDATRGYATGAYASRDYSSASSASYERPAASSYTSRGNAGSNRSTASSNRSGRGSNVVDFNGANPMQQVKVFHPQEFMDGVEYADCLRANQAVVLNLEETEPAMSRRITDFISGAAFALGGKVSRVSTNTVVATPSTIDIVGDKLSGLLDNPLSDGV
jgi:FtsZ-interacting cell division protein YlmF